ncbi:MAG: HDIG domain-containing protein [Ignavibacteria bacterium]|nr:HDIG domain-containing protein [Ignavibacteria bacterium]
MAKENKAHLFHLPEGYNFKTSKSAKLLIGIITIVIISAMLPSYKNIDSEYEVGTIWSKEDLIAPFSFPIYKDEADYEKEKQEARMSVNPVFDEQNKNSITADSLAIFFRSVSAALKEAAELEKNNQGGLKSSRLEKPLAALYTVLSPEDITWLFLLYKKENANVSLTLEEFRNAVENSAQENYYNNVINISKDSVRSSKISIKKENVKVQLSEDKSNVIDKKELMNMMSDRLRSSIKDTTYINIAKKILNSFVRENLIYNKELTDLEIQNKIEKIPNTIGIVKGNERIVSKHDPINRNTKLKLDSYKKVRLEKLGVEDYFVQYVGKVLTVLILALLTAFFLYYIRRNIYDDNLKLILIASLIILVSFVAYISLKINVNAPVEYLIFASVASILFTILFDSRLSFYMTIIGCFLIASIRGGDYTIAFVSFCGCVLAIFSVQNVKNRSQIFRSFYFMLIGYSISILAVGLDKTEEPSKILLQILFGGINSMLSPIIAYGLLIFYERFFKITTDLTLLELSDFNHPLLKELSSKAPGTFHHSIVMGNLSEAAAEAIGANSTLARVGCYYHDIGKTLKPQYFIENQLDQNKHENLNPNISTKLIISHVKDGIELAKKYNMPQEIVDFIPMHHGTTLVSYFYNKAKFIAKTEEISEYIYRYPGPKPQTKETGIVMLADAIEASTRAIEEPTPQKIESRIDDVIKARFMEGELDECELTLKDLTKIKQSFLKILIGIHHHRIQYPEQKKLEFKSKVY